MAKGERGIRKIDAEMTERIPKERHIERMKSLYVDPKSETEWNRPADRSAREAFEFLVDAMNDYRGPHQRYRVDSPISEILLEDDPELYGVLEKMTDRPTLWAPVNPSWPS